MPCRFSASNGTHLGAVRSPHTPLTVERSDFDILDRDAAVETLRHIYGPASVARGASDQAFRWTARSYAIGTLRLSRGTFPHGLRLHVLELGKHLFVFPRSGAGTVTVRDEPTEFAPGRAVMLPLFERFSFEFSEGFATMTLAITPNALGEHFFKLTHRPLSAPLRFTPRIDVTQGPTSGVARLIAFLFDECDRPGGLTASPLMLADLHDAVLTAMLTGLPHDQSHALAGPAPWIAPGYVRRAEEWLDPHAHEPVTISKAAVAAGVSVRSLQEAFRRYRGVSPQQFLKERRIELARTQLLAGEAGATVKSIATATGYNNPGRFSAEYHRRFGELPSETLRRAQRAHGIPSPVPPPGRPPTHQ